MMKKLTVLFSTLVISSSVLASDFDLTQTMKKMGFEFKKAAEAQSVDAMKTPVMNLSELVDSASNAEYPTEKQALYMDGFNKLAVALDGIETQLEAGKLDAAKASLREVDDLRVEFHDKRNPSIWSKIFG